MIIMLIGSSKLILYLGFALAVASFYVPTPMLTSALKTSNDFTRCDACHVQEQDEFSKSVVHRTLMCTDCHNISDFAPDLYSHNSTTFECIYCHVEQNASNFYNDAHKTNANNTTMCVGCHTHGEFNIESHRYNGMNLTASAANGRWELTNTLS